LEIKLFSSVNSTNFANFLEFSPISLISNKWTQKKKKTLVGSILFLKSLSTYLYIHMCVFVSIFMFYLFWGNLWRICLYMCLTIFQILSLCKNLRERMKSLVVTLSPCRFSSNPSFSNGIEWKMADWKLFKFIHLLAQVVLFNYPQKQNDNNQVGDPIAIPIQQLNNRSHQKFKHLF
jgi:hypothetical protein